MNSNSLLQLEWFKSLFAREYFKNKLFGSFNNIDAYSGRQVTLPSDAYKVVDTDETAASIRYYGYVTPDAGTPITNYGWYIMKATLVSGTWAAGVVSYTFASWDNGTGVAIAANDVLYRTAGTGAWADRANLTYANYEDVF